MSGTFGQSYDTVTVVARDEGGNPIVGATATMPIQVRQVVSDPITRTSQKVWAKKDIVARTNEGGMAILQVPSNARAGLKVITLKKSGRQTVTAQDIDPKRTEPFTVTMRRTGMRINWPLSIGITAGVFVLLKVVRKIRS